MPKQMSEDSILKPQGKFDITNVTFREIVSRRRRYVSRNPDLHTPISIRFELNLQPINLQVSRIFALLIGTSRNNFVRVIKVHGIQADDSYSTWDNIDCIICPTLEDLQVGKWDKVAPYPSKGYEIGMRSHHILIDRNRKLTTYDAYSFVILLGPGVKMFCPS